MKNTKLKTQAWQEKNDIEISKQLEEIRKEEEAKCEGMRRAFGLIVNKDPDAYDCTCCELERKC